jgi:hypothetical protein
MFPFPFNSCCGDAESRRKARAAQLDFLKWVRDSLETRLSATNAAISTIERQLNEEPSPES